MLLIKKTFLILVILALSACSSFRVLWEQGKNGDNTVCLTFDDGPNDISTKKVLNVLERQKVPAIFFVIGKNAEKYPELLKEISLKGFEIGNHSYEHDSFLFANNSKFIATDILKTNKIIKRITGNIPRFFRPPNGVINENIEKACKSIKIIPVGVNIFVNDPMLFNENIIYNKVINEIKQGINILVLHDGLGTFEKAPREFVSAALDQIINELKNKGYKFGKLNTQGMCE
jgi:peptidoglycan/xylan/chitin deacetylase (PgdA/CDA1 family)